MSQASLQNISKTVGGYQGYEVAQHRQTTDRSVRQYLRTKIKSILEALSGVKPAGSPEDMARLAELTSLTRRALNTISQSLSDPTYVGSAFFTFDRLSGTRLEKIYKFEIDMLEELIAIAEEVQALKNTPLDKNVIEDHFLHIKEFIDNFNQSLFERESLVLGND
jgi:hypothetical protein